jgi:hypothetical protein
MKRSWYIRESKWKKIVEEALNYRINRDFISNEDLRTSDSYNLLSSDKPDFLDESVWNELLEKATEKLKSIYSYKVHYLYEPNKILEFSKQSKPKFVKDIVWNELLDSAEEKYCESSKKGVYEVEELIIALKSQKPDEIKEENWIKLKTELRKLLIKELEHRIYVSDAPYTYIQNIDLSVLENESQIRLKKNAYRNQFDSYNSVISADEAKEFLSSPKPDWIKDDDYAKLQKRAKKLLEIEEKEIDFEAKLDNLSRDKQKLDEQLKEVSAIKQKIENQLEIINTVVNKPEKMERIEDYSHSFAPGNFENLKKLAELEKANSAK